MKPKAPASTSPGSERARQHLTDLRQELLGLHKSLIESERVTYESTFGKIQLKGDFLQLLIQDPWFAWLRPLSQLVALIDESLDAKEPATNKELKGLVDQTKALLKAPETTGGFAENYREALQRDPDVVLAHAEVSKLLDPTSSAFPAELK